MKTLIFAWTLSLAVLVGGGVYLWFAEMPVAQAEPAKVLLEVDASPQIVTTGPLAIDVTLPAQEEDCLGTC